ncbi:alpha/beta hydrolase [Streptomyces sp. NPDC046465]|uniref:alpha/beta hydrolase n=1 Tax=Streptomyces sp. NPDC046465 TaxID=3155810 RepID=UPI0033CD6F9F
MRNVRVPSLVAVGALSVLISLLTPTSAPTPSTVSVATEPSPSAARQKPKPKPHWQRCDAKSPAAFQCATLEVPLDYGDPGGRTIDIAISRLRASSAKERRGVLLLNPGGPGQPGLNLPVDPVVALSKDVQRQYDLIGFDPRGVGRSSPVGCGLTGGELDAEHPYTPWTFAKDVRWARTVAAKCRAAAGATLRHLTTRNTARDMDVIRGVLGEKKISYLGFSYGTYLGAVYTQLFPRRTDRFVLDSAADPTGYGRGMFQAMAKRAEPAFARWAEWTARHHATYALGRTPAEVRGTFWGLVARADREPVDYEGTRFTGDIIRAQRDTFSRVRKAAAWVAGLKRAAESGKPPPYGTSGQPASRRPPEPAPGFPSDGDASGTWAVLCADTRASWPRDPERYRSDAIRDRARYPLSGDFASGIKPCAFWQPGSEPRTEVDNSVRALILQNEWDPSTPLAGARAMHRALRGSRMVTVVGGEGHIVNGTNSCADRSATAYLTTGRLPADDLTCRPRDRHP